MGCIKKRIVITGASGFTGAHTIQRAIQSGMDVTCIARNPSKLQPSSLFTMCDLNDYLRISDLIKNSKPDYVLHLAGFNDAARSWESPLQCLETNIGGTLHLLEAIRKHAPDCRTLVVGSALQYMSCKGEKPPHPYSLSKTIQILLAEEWKDLFSMNIAIVKPSNLIGPGYSQGICSKIAEIIVAGEQKNEAIDIHLKNRKAQCDFVDVRDVAHAYFQILTTNSECDLFDVGSGSSRTLEEVINYFRHLTTQTIRISDDECIEAPSVNLDLKPIRSLGWTPQYSIQTSLYDVLSFYRSMT